MYVSDSMSLISFYPSQSLRKNAFAGLFLLLTLGGAVTLLPQTRATDGNTVEVK